MGTAWLIAKKEIGHALNSQLAYILSLVFVVSLPVPIFWSSSKANLFLSGHLDLGVFFSTMPLFLMVFIPALAMRTWSGEHQTGAMEMLLTMPIRESELVLGKFLGNYVLICGCILATFMTPLLANRMGDLDWGPVFAGYCGALLVSACCLAMAMFAGAFTQNQATAFVLGFLLLAFLMFIDVPRINPYVRFSNIARGVFDSRDLVWSLLTTALFLFLNVLQIRRRR